MMDKKKAAGAVFILLLISGCVGLAAYPYAEVWISMSVLALLLSFLIISIIYMVSEALQLQTGQMWAKNELYQTVATAIMLGMVIVLWSFLDTTVVRGVTGYTGVTSDANTMFDVSRQYLGNLEVMYITRYIAINALSIQLGMWSSVELYFMPVNTGFILRLGQMMRAVFDFMRMLMNALSVAIGLTEAQTALLNFAQFTMIQMFLPLGIVLRAFPFTRGIGGALMAIAIGFYLVYPLTFIMNKVVMERHYQLSGASWKTSIDRFMDCIGKFTFKLGGGGFGSLLAMIVYIAASAFFIRYALWFFSFEIWSAFFSTGFVHELVYGVFIFSIILPILNVFFTLTFIREVSRIIGDDINLAALTRLI